MTADEGYQARMAPIRAEIAAHQQRMLAVAAELERWASAWPVYDLGKNGGIEGYALGMRLSAKALRDSAARDMA